MASALKLVGCAGWSVARPCMSVARTSRFKRSYTTSGTGPDTSAGLCRGVNCVVAWASDTAIGRLTDGGGCGGGRM